jgi:O-methyltransferase
MIRQMLRQALALGRTGRGSHRTDSEPVEFSDSDRKILRFVLKRRLTMASPERVIATINACKYAVGAGIEGDFAECGVWRGGNSIAAKMTFESYGSDKRVWLFDTFAGMTAPTDADTTRFSSETAAERFSAAERAEHNEWCFASLEDVRANFEHAGVNMGGVSFVAGDVRETLLAHENVPEKLCVLRVDTDFYDSTKIELERLYPRLVKGGSLLIDDFGHWDGARRAVQEYFETFSARSRPLLQLTDYTGRMGVKP